MFLLHCHTQEAYVVNNEEGKSSPSSVMPRDKYPKPLIFHDGRLEFLPTPSITLCMFMWLPIGILLAIYRRLSLLSSSSRQLSVKFSFSLPLVNLQSKIYNEVKDLKRELILANLLEFGLLD